MKMSQTVSVIAAAGWRSVSETAFPEVDSSRHQQSVILGELEWAELRPRSWSRACVLLTTNKDMLCPLLCSDLGFVFPE